MCDTSVRSSIQHNIRTLHCENSPTVPPYILSTVASCYMYNNTVHVFVDAVQEYSTTVLEWFGCIGVVRVVQASHINH